MKPNLTPPRCCGCESPAELVPKLTRFGEPDLVVGARRCGSEAGRVHVFMDAF